LLRVELPALVVRRHQNGLNASAVPPLQKVSEFADFMAEEVLDPKPKMAESAALVPKLCMVVKPDPSENNVSGEWPS